MGDPTNCNCNAAGTAQYSGQQRGRGGGWHAEGGLEADMPLASGRETGSQLQWALYQRPLSNTRPPHHQNSVGTCCVRRVAQ